MRNRMQPLFEREGAGLGVRLRRERIDLALPIDAHRRHLRHRRVEGARLTAGRILGVIDALLVRGKKVRRSHSTRTPHASCDEPMSAIRAEKGFMREVYELLRTHLPAERLRTAGLKTRRYPDISSSVFHCLGVP